MKTKTIDLIRRLLRKPADHTSPVKMRERPADKMRRRHEDK